MTTFFIRHAESTSNVQGPIAGKDPVLSTVGKHQASLVGGFSNTVIVSSLTRALQTWGRSNMDFEKAIVTDLCREIRRGNPCDYLWHEDETVHETEEQINARVDGLKAMVRRLREDDPSQVITIFSHHCFIGHVTGVWPDNCQIVQWEDVA